MNLAKAYCLTRGGRETFDQAQHGLKTVKQQEKEDLLEATLEAYSTPNSKEEPNNFAEFMQVLTGKGLDRKTSYDLRTLIPQIVPGHRIWAKAANQRERFIAAHKIQFWNDHASCQMWLNIYIAANDLTRLGVTHARMLRETRLETDFRQVDCAETYEGQQLLCFEQIRPHQYQQHPADELSVLVEMVRDRLWKTVATVPPYSCYYLYLASGTVAEKILPQLLSSYALTFYLGSITRYRPHHYDSITRGAFGPRIEEFVSGQPLQFLYLMASEFALQDVVKPSIL